MICCRALAMLVLPALDAPLRRMIVMLLVLFKSLAD